MKCPYDLSPESDKKLTMNDLNWLSLKENHDYYYQIETQMLCVDVEFGDFVVWSANETKITRYSKDPSICDIIISKCTDYFYFYNAVIPELLTHIHTRNRKIETNCKLQLQNIRI